MGPFESQVKLLGETPPAGGDRVLRAMTEGLSPEERFLFEALAKAWLKFVPALERPETSDNALWGLRGGSTVVVAARNLAFHVLRTRTPPRSIRNVSSVAKPFTTLKRKPANVRRWFDQNRVHLLTLLSAKDWAPATPGVPVGDFLVSDTTGNGGLDQIVSLVKVVADKISRSRLPGVSKILYGNILITANLTGGLAFYRRKQDNVWIRPKTRFGPASQHSLSHELGHRYWQKVLSRGTKSQWVAWDRELREIALNTGKNATVVFPSVGQPVPMQVRGHGSRPPRVIRIETAPGGERHFFITKQDYLTGTQIRKSQQLRVRNDVFPTTYSRQSDYEEHFCDAFGLRVLNDLGEPHLEKFRDIIG